ncbi:MAG TPA: hypothetical protein ENK75_00140 [Saprospiraceae bacterium]|nr:hypothetical protein [Saprospiraceae bacterium]
MSITANENYYALIILLIDEMNIKRTKEEFGLYKNQFLKDLKLLNKLLVATSLQKLEDSLQKVKTICIRKVDKDDIDNNFQNYPIHTQYDRDMIAKWLINQNTLNN